MGVDCGVFFKPFLSASGIFPHDLQTNGSCYKYVDDTFDQKQCCMITVICVSLSSIMLCLQAHLHMRTCTLTNHPGPT